MLISSPSLFSKEAHISLTISMVLCDNFIFGILNILYNLFYYNLFRLFLASVKVFCMQKVMRLFAHRGTQKLLIQFGDVGILMRFANRFAGVFTVESQLTFLQDLRIPMVVRLSATSNASARARHDFNGMELALSFLDIFEQFAGISKSVSDTDMNRQTIEIDGGMSQSLHSSQFFEIQSLQFFAGKYFIGSTNRGFDDSTGGAEEDT